jgi:hypothetical protein
MVYVYKILELAKLYAFSANQCIERLQDKKASILANELGVVIHQHVLLLIVIYRY